MNNETLLIAPNPNAIAEEGVIATDTTTTTIETVGMADNLSGAVQILGQGMASIFVVLGLIAVVVAVLKKLDNKKK